MKKLLNIPALLFGLMLIVSSCGKDTKSDDTSKDNNKELCSLVESQVQLLKDSDDALRSLGDGAAASGAYYQIPQEELLRLKKEYDRIETESDKFLETRDGRTEADVESNFELMQSCPSFNDLKFLMAYEENNGFLDFIADFE